MHLEELIRRNVCPRRSSVRLQGTPTRTESTPSPRSEPLTLPRNTPSVPAASGSSSGAFSRSIPTAPPVSLSTPSTATPPLVKSTPRPTRTPQLSQRQILLEIHTGSVILAAHTRVCQLSPRAILLVSWSLEARLRRGSRTERLARSSLLRSRDRRTSWRRC